MQTILEELFYGNIRPDVAHYGLDSEFAEAVEMRERNRANLLKLLNEQEKEIFDKYCDMQGEVEGIARLDKFTYGFKLGAMLMAEVFMQPLDAGRNPN